MIPLTIKFCGMRQKSEQLFTLFAMYLDIRPIWEAKQTITGLRKHATILNLACICFVAICCWRSSFTRTFDVVRSSDTGRRNRKETLHQKIAQILLSNQNLGMHVYEGTSKQKKMNEFVNIDGSSGLVALKPVRKIGVRHLQTCRRAYLQTCGASVLF